MKGMLKNKRGMSGGLITGLVFGIAGLVIGTLIAFVIVSTLNGAGLLTSGSAEESATTGMIGNFTDGVNSVSTKLPTVLLVGAVVLVIGVLAILVGVWKKMQMGGGI